MRVQWVVYVLVEASYRAPTPVLKDMHVGVSLVLQERKRESHLASLLSKQNKSNRHFLKKHLTMHNTEFLSPAELLRNSLRIVTNSWLVCYAEVVLRDESVVTSTVI